MRTTQKILDKLRLVALLAAIVLTTFACSDDALFPPEKQPTLTATYSLSRPTRTPAPRPLVSIDVSATATSSPTVLGAKDLEAFQITTSGVSSVSWSDTGKLIYYATGGRVNSTLDIVTYDVTTHLTMSVPLSPAFGLGIPQRVDIDDFIGYDDYPEILGYISPSGRFVIFSVTFGNPSPAPASPDPFARTEVWVADLSSHQRTKVLERFLGDIHQAIWFDNENRVIFDFGYEGGANLYIAKVRDGTVVPLEEASDFEGGTEQLWAVSPDGKTLAIIGRELTLWLVSLESGESITIEKYVRTPVWAANSKLLYYWWGPSFDAIETLHAYDLVSGDISTIIDRARLADIFRDLPGSNFAVSPSGNRFAFWGGWLWLVELHN